MFVNPFAAVYSDLAAVAAAQLFLRFVMAGCFFCICFLYVVYPLKEGYFACIVSFTAITPSSNR
jgi:hypothetical protein